VPHGFSRYVARDVDMDGVVPPAGSRAIVFFEDAKAVRAQPT